MNTLTYKAPKEVINRLDKYSELGMTPASLLHEIFYEHKKENQAMIDWYFYMVTKKDVRNSDIQQSIIDYCVFEDKYIVQEG